MGREEGGGFRMGNPCMPVADSFLYMAEPINIVKFKNKIKFKKKKERNKRSSVFVMIRKYSACGSINKRSTHPS